MADQSKTREPMSWEDVCHFIAQGAVNIEAGENVIQAGSLVHQAMTDFCYYASTERVREVKEEKEPSTFAELGAKVFNETPTTPAPPPPDHEEPLG